MNLTDQIAAMLADAEKATGPFRIERTQHPDMNSDAPAWQLTCNGHPIMWTAIEGGLDKQLAALDSSRTRLPALAKALLVAVKELEKYETDVAYGFMEGGPSEIARMILAAIAKELGGVE